MRLNPNRLILPIAIIILAVLAISGGYRLEIGTGGLKFENNGVAFVGK